jgi:hypothetical protein
MHPRILSVYIRVHLWFQNLAWIPPLVVEEKWNHRCTQMQKDKTAPHLMDMSAPLARACCLPRRPNQADSRCPASTSSRGASASRRSRRKLRTLKGSMQR